MSPCEVELWVVHLNPDTASQRRVADLLDADEHARASRFYFERDRRRWEVARGALRWLLARRLGTAPNAIVFDADDNNKPQLGGALSDTLQFNLSHSADMALVGLASHPLGVDVEALRDVPDLEAIINRFFSSRECEEILAAPNDAGARAGDKADDRTRRFFHAWTRKEAVLKALGTGLFGPLQSIDVTLVPGVPAQLRAIEAEHGTTADWGLAHLEPGAGYVGAVAMQGATPVIGSLRVFAPEWLLADGDGAPTSTPGNDPAASAGR